MSAHELQSQVGGVNAALSAIGHRLREAGMALVGCDQAGQLINRGRHGDDWLTALLCGSPLFRSHVVRAAEQWKAHDEPGVFEVMPGVWLAPFPLTARRRRVGYSIAVILTEQILEAEQLAAMCQSSRMDLELCRRELNNMGPAGVRDVERLAALARGSHEDQLRLTAGNQAIESIGRQLAESYEEINLLYTIIQSMTVQERPERFVALACQELLATLPYGWIGTQFAENRERLKSLSGRLIYAGDPGQSAAVVRDVAVRLFKRAQPGESIVLEPGRKAQDKEFALLGQTVVAQPVTSHGELVGLLIAGGKQGPDIAASSVDMKLLGATATHMAIFLENAALYDDLQDMFMGTLEALTASIDAKDRYTCGHSRRVAHLTAQLAQAIGLDEHTVGRMHIAGLVHDVGKIGVPEAVLLKPGKLNVEEYAWIQKHPEIGYRILKDIPQLNDILPGVLHHHERWDGCGYPHTLRGEEIPLIARLIALADSFDAMSSTRTYRSALSRRQVLAEIEKCTGAQFDPSLACVFLKLDFSEFDRLVREHRASEMQAAGQREQAA